MHKLQIDEQGSSSQVQDLPSKIFIPTSRLMRKVKKITTDELPTRTKFLHFINQAPCSLFKKLIVTSPTLLQGLDTMSLELRPQECKHVKLCERLPVPYVPTKDKVQDDVAKLWNLNI